MSKKFELGQIAITSGVYGKMMDSILFQRFVEESLIKYMKCDWGCLSKSDKKASNDAVKNGNRIMGAYKDYIYDITIWIITEWDRSVTTILFPHEY